MIWKSKIVKTRLILNQSNFWYIWYSDVVDRFNGQAHLQAPQMAFVSWHSKHSRNKNKFDVIKLSGASGVKNGVKQMDYTVSVGCIKETCTHMIRECLAW